MLLWTCLPANVNTSTLSLEINIKHSKSMQAVYTKHYTF